MLRRLAVKVLARADFFRLVTVLGFHLGRRLYSRGYCHASFNIVV